MTETKVTRPESLSTRVRRGVALLDEKVPGWHNRIDVDELDLTDTCHCVLGQITGQSYWTVIEGWLGLTSRVDFEDHGFDVVSAGIRSGRDLYEFHTLTRMWRLIVRIRRSVFYVHRDESGVDLAYRIDWDGTVSVWSEKYGWHESKFHNLCECSEYDRAHFADHLVPVTVDALPVGAR